MKQVYYKQNEKFEYEFFKDKECKQEFEFNREDKNFYLELKEGNISPITALNTFKDKKGFTGIENVFIPYIPECQLPAPKIIKTLKDITPNYSKYIPDNCAVVFLNEEDLQENRSKFVNQGFFILPNMISVCKCKELNKFCKCTDEYSLKDCDVKKLIIFTKELTSANIKQINDTAKVLKKNFGIEWVGVFAELCFIENPPPAWAVIGEDGYFGVMVNGKLKNAYFDKLITTNATGLLEPQESELLQVIDCKEIFEEFFETNE